LARAVLQPDAERLVHALALLVEPVDVALFLQDREDRARLLRHRRERLILVRDVGVADPREEVGDRVGYVRRHLLDRGYHEAFVTPGSSPRCASSRKHMRHSRKRLYTARERPQRWHRVYARTRYFCCLRCLLTNAFFAMSYPLLSSPRPRPARA